MYYDRKSYDRFYMWRISRSMNLFCTINDAHDPLNHLANDIIVLSNG